MYKNKGNKWNRRICKWIASLLTVALLINQSSFWVLAEEGVDEVCCCDTRCSVDSVNGACPVCTKDYGRCGGAEIGADTDTSEESELPGAGEDMNTGTDTENVPDTATDEGTDNPDVGTDIAADDETADSDTDESGNTDVDTDADTDAVSDVDADDEAENIVEEDAVSPASVGDTFTDNGITYKIINEDENDLQVEVTRSSGSGKLVIPSTASDGKREYAVVGIGERAFYRCGSLESVTIPYGVTSIGVTAFYECFSLTSVAIPETVTIIGDGAFAGCQSLTNVTIPYGVTFIATTTFMGCNSLTDIVIPDSVTIIATSAFAKCINLKSVTIPEGVREIMISAFSSSGLISVTIPSSVTSIGYSAFNSCHSLKSVTILNDNISIGYKETFGYAFAYCEGLNSFEIAVSENLAGTPFIGSNCFWGSNVSGDSLTFLTEDGTTELSSTTTPTLAEAVEAYDAADGTKDGKWYGWKLPNDSEPDVTDYPVTIKVNKDGSTWSDCGKTFALSADNGVTFITDLTAVSNGIYTIYETEKADGTGYVSTGFTVEVTDAAAEATVNYYTVTFYDGDNVLDEQIVPDNTKVNALTDTPTREGYTFDRWSASKDGSTEFDFEAPITERTSIYAKWIIPSAAKYPVTINVNLDDSVWGDCGKSFVLSADNGVTFITDLTDVSNGTYTIYDITGASDSTGYVKTGVTVEVKDSAAKAEINYYSVTFYDDDTIFAGRIVPNNTKVSAPLPPPTKEGYTFYRWATSEGGSTEFDFNNPITAKTDVYASWIADEEELFIITVVAGPGGSVSPSGDVTVKSGADQQFTITPQDGYQISSVLVDGNEVLHSVQARDYAKAGITDAANNVKYYDFENVTSDHTLAAYFEASNPGGDDSDDNNGGGGTGGDDSGNSGGGGSGGGDSDNNGGSGGGNVGGNGTPDSSGGGNVGGNGTPDNSVGGASGNNNSLDSFVSISADSSSNPDDSGSSVPLVASDTNVGNGADVTNTNNTTPATKDNEPKTGDASHPEIYATITMIAGLSYLLLYFADGKSGMTEDEKKEIIASLVNWAKKGSRIKKYAALAVIFLILVYYHSIGKRTTVDWKEVYEK